MVDSKFCSKNKEREKLQLYKLFYTNVCQYRRNFLLFEKVYAGSTRFRLVNEGSIVFQVRIISFKKVQEEPRRFEQVSLSHDMAG